MRRWYTETKILKNPILSDGWINFDNDYLFQLPAIQNGSRITGVSGYGRIRVDGTLTKFNIVSVVGVVNPTVKLAHSSNNNILYKLMGVTYNTVNPKLSIMGVTYNEDKPKLFITLRL